LENMEAEMKKVIYAEITEAVRDSAVNGLDIKDGDVIGIVNGSIKTKGSSHEEVVFGVLEEMVSEDVALITLLYGSEIQENEAQALKDKITEEYPECEVELHYGGQPHYAYLLAVE